MSESKVKEKEVKVQSRRFKRKNLRTKAERIIKRPESWMFNDRRQMINISKISEIIPQKISEILQSV
ncbi:hypothetical protein CBW18_03425 [Pedobacter sp. AJM]|jgi:hypothetical protein|nr:hypothetical protein CBW18_03425 [Pedobacter sp. AJM]